MLLCKIDGEMNMQNCGFPRKCEMDAVTTCSTTDGNGSYHETAATFFDEMTRCRRKTYCQQQPGNPNGPSKFCKYRVYLPLSTVVPRLTATAVATHPHHRISKR